MSTGIRQRQTDIYDRRRDEFRRDGSLKSSKGHIHPKKSLHDIKYHLLGVVACFCILTVLIVSLFLHYPYKNYPVPYDLPSPPKLEGPLSPNNILSKSSPFLHGSIKGPEFLLFHKGLLYTGTHDGLIVEISKNGDMRTVTRLGKEPPCGDYSDEPTCGRPLGMEFDGDGYLVVCDAYLGIMKVDVNTGDVQMVVPASTVVNGRRLNFLNDLEITDDGDIYFTDSSTVHQRRDFIYDIIQGAPNGRLLKFDPIKGLTEVVLSYLNFPNGLLLSQFQDYILVAETSRARILKYNIKGINAGQVEVFADNLPCLPDNLHYDQLSRSILVACGYVRHEGMSLSLLDFLKQKIWVRRFFMELPMQKFLGFLPQGSMMIEINESGQVKRSFMDLNGSGLSHVVRDENGRYYFGSFGGDRIHVLDVGDLDSSE